MRKVHYLIYSHTYPIFSAICPSFSKFHQFLIKNWMIRSESLNKVKIKKSWTNPGQIKILDSPG